jgi:Tfp pilus assembly protein PilF
MVPLIKRSFLMVLWVVTCLLMVACSSVKTYQVTSSLSTAELFNDAVMMPKIKPPDFIDVFTLSESQKDAFSKELHRPANRNRLDIEVIYRYLQTRLQNFNFYSKTLTARQALQHNAGNCLTLALLTNALAQATNVGVYNELAKTPPVFQRKNGYLLNSQHIQTVIYVKKMDGGFMYSTKPLKLKIDYFSTEGSRALRRVSPEEFQAMYYSNVAAEALVDDQNKKAYWYLKQALLTDPDNPIALNMLAVLYRQMGYDNYAEKVFIHGLSLAKNQLELLSNYHRFLLEKNRVSEAKRVAEVIDDYDDPDPFKWVDVADQALLQGQYQQAVKHFKKAQRQAPYLHEPSAGLAKAYFYLGEQDKALKAMQEALQNTHRKSIIALYQAKYDYLKNQTSKNP